MSFFEIRSALLSERCTIAEFWVVCAPCVLGSRFNLGGSCMDSSCAVVRAVHHCRVSGVCVSGLLSMLIQ